MNQTIMMAQLRPHKGDYVANMHRIATICHQCITRTPRPDVLVFPETALSGYFLEGGVRELARTAGHVFVDINTAYCQACANDSFADTDAPLLDIVVGFYERYRDRFYNSAMYATLGSPLAHNAEQRTPGIVHVHRKVFLPTYGVFDDARFVEAGHHFVAFDTANGRAAMLICEDAWHNVSGLIAALDGAQIVYILSASPARGTSGTRPDNVEHWEDLAHRIADEHGVFVVLAQQVGFEGGKGFAGNSLMMNPRGVVMVAAPLWQETLIAATIDTNELPLARADTPLLADLETMLPHMQHEINRVAQRLPAAITWDACDACHTPSHTPQIASPPLVVPDKNICLPENKVQPHPFPLITAPTFNPTADDMLHMNVDLVHEWLIAFLRDEVTMRRGFTTVVLALSGGVDSALVAFLCAEAFGAHNVLAIRMPYRTSSSESLDHAQLCIDQLGIKATTVDISAAVDAYATLDPTIDARRKGNIMARMRMIILFDHSQKLGSIPIGTGNKTERLFGYFTWHADDSPPVNPLGDLFKTQVWQLARFMGVPSVIVDKPASADLIVGQTDEADFGISYPQADRLLHFLIQGYPESTLEAMGFDPADIRVVTSRLHSTHWKRHLPSSAMVSSTAIGEFYLRPLDY